MISVKQRWLVSFCIATLLTPGKTYAHLENLSFEELVRRANYIFIGKVLKTSKRWNGSMVSEVKIEQPVKGALGDKAVVSYGQPYNRAREDLTQLEVDNIYLFYVVKVGNKLQLIGPMGEDYYLIRTNSVRCGDKQASVDSCVKKLKKMIIHE